VVEFGYAETVTTALPQIETLQAKRFHSSEKYLMIHKDCVVLSVHRCVSGVTA
jgi:hypothetical protein